MAQPATNPKIDELRLRLKADPKSRLFFPLAEELRKAGQVGEAEQVLRGGLSLHATYLSAWVSLGRVLRDQQKDAEAVHALTKSLQLDPGNVVAARLLADAYLALGEKVEAIKKYKLVHALLPSDQELEAQIQRLQAEIDGESQPAPIALSQLTEAELAVSPGPLPPSADPGRVFDETGGHLLREQFQEEETRDVEPMRVAHSESPFEEPVAEQYPESAFELEAPAGMHIETPFAAESEPSAEELLLAEPPLSVTEELEIPFGDEPEPAPVLEDEEEAEVFAPTGGPAPSEAPADDLTQTLTMADLYARQGLVDEAKHIYENVLVRDPANAAVREKLHALGGSSEVEEPAVATIVADDSASSDSTTKAANEANGAKIRRLESWLSRVGKREVSGV